MTTIYETTGKGYEQQGDYVLPNIEIDDEKEYHIGIWIQCMNNICERVREIVNKEIVFR
ncbi:MAG: hypothetical protein UHS49_06770 [Faecalimonas sp.]|nr:hypothetical protein [Faecalimonas sp.]